MTASQFLSYEIDNVGVQLEKCCTGMPEAAQDTKLTPEGMTPRECLEHLCEVYKAAATTVAGGKHEWGSYSAPDKAWEALWTTLQVLRNKAAAALTASESEESLKLGHEFVIAHDAYHVGQLALSRMKADPEWDPHSIYAK